MEKWQGSLPVRIKFLLKTNWTVNGLDSIKFEKIKTVNFWAMFLSKMDIIWKEAHNIVISSLRSPIKIEIKMQFIMDISCKQK